jgi:hypothetical protein
MKISNNRVKQPISIYDQARIDTAKQNSDSRVVSRANADKAREESIKATTEYNKGLLDAAKSQMDLDKSRLDANKSQFDLEKAKAMVSRITLEHAKTQEYTEQVRLSKETAEAEADKAKAEADKAKAEADKAQADALALHITLEHAKTQEYTEQVRLIKATAEAEADKAKSEADKAQAEADKAQAEADKSQCEAKIAHSKTVSAQLQIKQEETKKIQFEAEISQCQTVKALLQIKQEETTKTQFDTEIAQLATNKVLLLANTAKDNATIICSLLELNRIDIEKSRLALEKAHVTNAPAAIAAKAQAIVDKSQSDASILVQRSKIMKTLQILSIKSCKRVDELYFNKSVISITNIYQKTYNNNKCATGFGDFIRGCYFVLDFCEIFHFQPNIVINHPLYEFLENSYITHNSGEVEIVSMFDDNNWNKHILNRDNIIINTIRRNDTMSKFVNYLCTSHIDNNNINIYNILFPYFDVSTEHKKVMCDILKPTQEMKEYVVSTLAKFELTENNYISIHIRSGDNYLNCVDKQFNLTYLNHITNDIITLLNKHPNTSFLLIADNNFIKFHLSSKKIHRLYIIFNEIGHLGENTQLDRNQVKNTMLDFYLFAYSSNIYAFSSYDHGSGFSFWCAKTYGIPYSCKIIKH